jgi:hypothetical protein
MNVVLGVVSHEFEIINESKNRRSRLDVQVVSVVHDERHPLAVADHFAERSPSAVVVDSERKRIDAAFAVVL